MNTEHSHIDISGIRVDVIRKDIKNIHLAVYPPTGRVRVSTPRFLKDETLRLFLVSKLGWIQKHTRRMKQQPRVAEREYIQGESHWLFGKRYLLNVVERDQAPEVHIRNKKYLDLYVRPGSSFEKREEVMREWYRELLKSEIPALVMKWENALGVTVQKWGVKKMKTRWGTCNTRRGFIWLNLELAKQPLYCLDYVVLHEIAHLIERGHNHRFWSIIEKHMPGWKKIREEMNEMGC